MSRILVTDDLHLGNARFDDVAVDDRAGISREELLDIVAGYEGLITRSRTQVDDTLLAAASNLVVIGRGGVGVDNIDLEAASRRGVVVLNAPEANNVSAAELAIGLMLAAARGIGRSDRRIREGVWDRKYLGREVKGATLGIVGLGRIGSLVARRAQALGMTVLAYDPYVGAARADDLKVELLDELPAMLMRTDFLTVHTPATEETIGMIGAEQLACLRPDAIVVNAARGGIVDEVALADALASGHLFAAGLDVFRDEPPSPDHPLVLRDDVVMTAHLGANTREAQRRVGEEILLRTVEALRGDYSRGVVNAPALSSDVLRELGGHLRLGEILGKVAVQLIKGRVTDLSIEFAGEFPRDPDPVATAVTKGFLEPILTEAPNYVNAGAIARDRDIRVSKVVASRDRGYTTHVEVVASSEEGSVRVAGTLLGGDPRIVAIDDFGIEIRPAPAILVCTNVDRPGAIGKVGTVLGDAGVNIIGMQLGRLHQGGRAMFALTLDEAPNDDVLDVLRSMGDVIVDLRLVRL